MATKKKAKKPSAKDHSRPEPADYSMPSLFSAEQVLRDIHRALDNRKLDGPDDLNAYLQTLHGPGLKKALEEAPPPRPQDEAQDLAYQAMEAESDQEALYLVNNALEKDPDCVDALVTRAELTAKSAKELINRLEHAVTTAERSLGPTFFEENKGHFWGLIETRPYMRARHFLADALYEDGKVSQAIAHYEALIGLNPNDNQGIRDILLGCYLTTDNLDGARRLLEAYKREISAVFAWGRTLECILSGDFARAAKALRHAREQNPYVEQYLTAKKDLPPQLPDVYSFGSEEEALVCMDFLAEAWALHPEALLWLHVQAKQSFYKKSAGA